jgi:hypothetical protein
MVFLVSFKWYTILSQIRLWSMRYGGVAIIAGVKEVLLTRIREVLKLISCFMC